VATVWPRHGGAFVVLRPPLAGQAPAQYRSGRPVAKGRLVSIPTAVVADLAPKGVIRAAINLGNPVLAQTGADGAPQGITVDIAREVARRAGVPLEFETFDAANRAFAALTSEALDLGFIAAEPERAAALEFSSPYVIIEGAYVVPADSPVQAIADVDRPGVRIAVGRGAAYHLFLQRHIRHAALVPADTGRAALDMFLAEPLEAAANVRQPLEKFAAAHGGLRVLPGRFMAIQQAVAVPKGRVAAARWLAQVVEELKASGFVAAALARSGQDAAVAPPA
jgi:polar amino acid transport system substrate-binding protein